MRPGEGAVMAAKGAGWRVAAPAGKNKWGLLPRQKISLHMSKNVLFSGLDNIHGMVYNADTCDIIAIPQSTGKRPCESPSPLTAGAFRKTAGIDFKRKDFSSSGEKFEVKLNEAWHGRLA